MSSRRIIAVLLENEAGALSRIVGLFAQRNYNIESLTVAPTEDETLSRLTLTTEGDHLEREIMMVKVRAEGLQRAEVKRTADIFRGQVIDVTENAYTVQLVGPSEKLDAFLRAVGTSTVVEAVRSGVSGIGRGDKTLR